MLLVHLSMTQMDTIQGVFKEECYKKKLYTALRVDFPTYVNTYSRIKALKRGKSGKQEKYT